MKVKLLGLTNKKFLEKQINICAAAGKLSRMEGTVFDAIDSMKDYEKALKFINRVISMGHTSTIDHDYMVFALSGVSPVVEQVIIAERFSSFTIKSRREVNFSKVGFYVPIFHDKNNNILENNNDLQKKYKKYMENLFLDYEFFINNGISKEDSRFILPYSYHSEIIMGLDGTSLARMINILTNTKYKNITELKELGDKLLEIAKYRAPYIETLLAREEKTEQSELESILNELGFYKQYKTLDKPILLSCTENIDETLFLNAITRLYSLDYNSAEKLYKEKIANNENLKEKIMKAIFSEPTHEDLKQINMRFQLSIPYAILTHYTRHRRLSLSIPDFVPINNLDKYLIPPSITNSKLKEKFIEIYNRNYKIYNEFKNLGIREDDLVYFTLSGNLVNVVINFDGEAFRWICRLRECTKAQWCIREAVTYMHKLLEEKSCYYVKNIGPDCVTKHICSEGKESCGRINAILAQIKKND